MKKYFIALEPNKLLSDLVLSQKESVYNLVGEQVYLSDPPHITLIVFTSDSEEELKIIFDNISQHIKKIPVSIEKMHIFYDDILTGGNTITYLFSEKETINLKEIQKLVIESISKINSKQLFSDDEKVNKMSETEKKNILECGFPFAGENWIPHLTIASIEKDKFEQVHELVLKHPIKGQFLLDSINLYSLSEGITLIKKGELE